MPLLIVLVVPFRVREGECPHQRQALASQGNRLPECAESRWGSPGRQHLVHQPAPEAQPQHGNQQQYTFFVFIPIDFRELEKVHLW